MTDWTDRIIELEEAKAAMIAAKKAVKAEAERKARAQARREIADRVDELEHRFARRLAQANADGMPQGLIRREVLRTGDWNTWVKYRDLAGIEPERVTVANARRERQLAVSPFRWSEDKSVLSVVKNSLGVDVMPPLEYDMGTNRLVGKIWWPDPVGGSDKYERAVRKGDRNLNDLVSAEIQRAIDAGEIEAGEVKP